MMQNTCENMGQRIIRPIDFSHLYLLPNLHIHTIGIAVFETFENLNLGNNRHYDKSGTMVMCRSGFMLIKINNRRYKLHKQNAIIIPPNSIYQLIKVSDNFHPLCISLSGSFLSKVFKNRINYTKYFQLAQQNALLSLKTEERESLFQSYEQLKFKFEHGVQYPFFKDILENLGLAIFHEAYGYMLRNRQPYGSPITECEQLFRDFIQLVVKHHKKERLTAYYAERLNVTPKYLAAWIKKVSQKTAKEWIDSYVVATCREQLSSSSKSIQQITNELHFPDQAFFCKYFKRHIGISPKDYRRSDDAKNITPCIIAENLEAI